MSDTIQIAVDLQNPGQYFACCGLLELADRYWGTAEGWFDKGAFWIATGGDTSLEELLSAVAGAPLGQLDADDDSFSPLHLGGDFNLRLDWWNDQRTGGQLLRTWAGKQCVPRIARAMQQALADPACQHATLLDHGQVVYEDARPDKKVEPFYFDARRGESCHVLDIGFSPNLLGMASVAYPAVEFLSLVGLQRFLPRCIEPPNGFEFYAWNSPLTPRVATAAACGALADPAATRCRFAWRYRSDQRKHKAFSHATLR